MINFHKMGFLDVRKLKSLTDGNNYWHHRYNPIWLFLWKDLYKPEIAFTNEFCFIRYLMPDIGICYYAPIGNDILKGIETIKQDAKENGFDFYLGPVSEKNSFQYQGVGIKLIENEQFDSYIYQAKDLAFLNGSKFKKNRFDMEEFVRTHKTSFFKKISKEEFPQILEFVEKWNCQNENKSYNQDFFSKLNMLKVSMEHMYELDLIALMLRDEEQIYGICIASVMDNEVCLHLIMALNDVKGCYDMLLTNFAKNAQGFAKYINFEEDFGIKELRKLKEGYNPVRLEKFYGNFSL